MISMITNIFSLVDTVDSDIWMKSPEMLDAHRLLKGKAVDCLELGRYLQLKDNDKQELKRSSEPSESKLESVLNKWISTECSNVTWKKLFDGVKVDLEWVTEAKEIKKFLQRADVQNKYSKKDIWEAL